MSCPNWTCVIKSFPGEREDQELKSGCVLTTVESIILKGYTYRGHPPQGVVLFYRWRLSRTSSLRATHTTGIHPKEWSCSTGEVCRLYHPEGLHISTYRGHPPQGVGLSYRRRLSRSSSWRTRRPWSSTPRSGLVQQVKIVEVIIRIHPKKWSCSTGEDYRGHHPEGFEDRGHPPQGVDLFCRWRLSHRSEGKPTPRYKSSWVLLVWMQCM